MFDKILIANRGEIACRVARTAKRMGIHTVSVYSDPDRNALHARVCDEARALGGSTAMESYLDMDKVIAAARDTGCQAIHPGYGFLSENPRFVEKCNDTGITFVGPSADSIRLMGSKSAARQKVSAAGVPVLPGYDGDDQSTAKLKQHAGKVGYPLLIKAVAGGGGKGMRVVEKQKDFADALQSVKRESQASFGDDRVLLERYLAVTRHVEVQVFADGMGNVVHLYERDCSMQRRHQKVIEESPAPGLESNIRDQMTSAAQQCAKSIDYLGAGTVEFLLAPDNSFYFMEMNTRLQVEHPVTEMVTGLDLVEWQLRVAAGEPLPLAQDEIKMSGHALEARIYAENPDNNFLPSTGTVHFINHPTESTTVRVDSGITTGDEISPYYDPMISKLVVIGSDRQDAIWKMHCALDQYAILGIRNNVSFLNRLVMDADFQKPALHTRLIEERLEQLIAAPDEQDEILGFAALYIYLANRQAQQDHQRHQDDQWSPWVGADNPGHDDVPGCKLLMGYGDERHEVEVSRSGQLFRLDSHGEPLSASLVTRHTLEISTQEGNQQLFVARDGANIYLHHRGHNSLVFYIDRLDQSGSAGDVTGTLNSPMPGSVVDVAVTQGQKVASGDNLMTIEAMKMEHRIRSPHDGIVTAINFAVGDKVDEGAALMVIE